MKILVTGGAGFIGSHLVRHLLSNPADEVINLDALRYSGNLDNLADVEASTRYTFVHGDICDPQVVASVFRDRDIEAVVNCAAETHVDRSLLDPCGFARTDVIGTSVLLEQARQRGVQRFLQVSTDEVYGSVESGFSTERDPLQPRSPYAASKAGGDLIALSHWTSYRLPVLITRGSNTYGPNQYPEKFIPLFVTNALEDEPLPLYGDGRQRRDWLSVYDHCAAIDLVLRRGEPGVIYNVGGGSELENLTVAIMILQYLDKPLDLIAYVQDRPGHDRRYALDCARLRSLGWSPTIGFHDGLRSTIDWYCNHRDWWAKIKSGEFRAYYDRVYGERLSETAAHPNSLPQHRYSRGITGKHAIS